MENPFRSGNSVAGFMRRHQEWTVSALGPGSRFHTCIEETRSVRVDDGEVDRTTAFPLVLRFACRFEIDSLFEPTGKAVR
jgi:hypothetical protein